MVTACPCAGRLEPTRTLSAGGGGQCPPGAGACSTRPVRRLPSLARISRAKGTVDSGDHSNRRPPPEPLHAIGDAKIDCLSDSGSRLDGKRLQVATRQPHLRARRNSALLSAMTCRRPPPGTYGTNQRRRQLPVRSGCQPAGWPGRRGSRATASCSLRRACWMLASMSPERWGRSWTAGVGSAGSCASQAPGW